MYGTMQAAGWLAQVVNGQWLGDGEPGEGRSLTEALWQALAAIRDAGIEPRRDRVVYVYEPTGQRKAEVRLHEALYWGDLVWGPAPHYVLTCEEITQAAILQEAGNRAAMGE